MVSKIGFIINPIAGMGGRVGLKGTDGVYEEAVKLGAKPIAAKKAQDMLTEFISIVSKNENIMWFTCTGKMGSSELQKAGISNFKIIYKHGGEITSSADTKKVCKKFMSLNVDLIVFCGGDGTASDIFEIVDKKIPLLGIPSGVKMHSGVFGINTKATAKILHQFVQNSLTVGDVEIMDLDEDLYRTGEWKIKLIGIAKGIIEPTYIQVGKSYYESISDDEIKDELSEHIADDIEKNNDFLYLFGSGGTIDYIARKLNLENTLLGIDAVYRKKIVGKDLNEKNILDLLKKYKKIKLLLSPIGAQGFILGRGNLQLSPPVITKIGIDNIIIISTPSKLLRTPVIRVDTGDKALDHKFVEYEYLLVVIGYHLSRVVKIQTNNF